MIFDSASLAGDVRHLKSKLHTLFAATNKPHSPKGRHLPAQFCSFPGETSHDNASTVNATDHAQELDQQPPKAPVPYYGASQAISQLRQGRWQQVENLFAGPHCNPQNSDKMEQGQWPFSFLS